MAMAMPNKNDTYMEGPLVFDLATIMIKIIVIGKGIAKFEDKTGIPAKHQRFVFDDKPFDDEKIVLEYDIPIESCLDLTVGEQAKIYLTTYRGTSNCN